MNKLDQTMDERVAYWTLRGRLLPDNRFKHMLGIQTYHPPRKIAQPSPSDLRLELLDDSKKQLLVMNVPSRPYFPDTQDDRGVLAIHSKVPFHPKTKVIRLLKDEVLIKEWKRPAAAPLLKSLSIKQKKKNIELTWEATHPDKMYMEFVVRFSTDGGETFNRLSGRLTKPRFKASQAELPGGKGWIFQVAATDGVNTTTLNSDPVDLPETLPSIEISSPSDGETLSHRQRVMFDGDVIEFLGQELHASSVVWKSDRDGVLSDQMSFVTNELSKGLHHITLEILDDRKKSMSAEISISVV